VVANGGTVVEIDVLLFTTKVVDNIPLNFTAVAPVKFVPVMVTIVPTSPLVGVKDVIVGSGIGKVVTVKSAELVAVPSGVVTDILPVVAPAGTVAFTDVAVISVIVLTATAVPLNLIEVIPPKFVPLIVTTVPTIPLAGVKELKVGDVGALTIKLVILVAVPSDDVAVIFPVVAPTGTVTFNDVSVRPVTEFIATAVPLNFIEVMPIKFVPVRVITVPIGPLVGEKEVMVGTVELTSGDLLPPPQPAIIIIITNAMKQTAIQLGFKVLIRKVAIIKPSFG
jgi:hypothetical protein